MLFPTVVRSRWRRNAFRRFMGDLDCQSLLLALRRRKSCNIGMIWIAWLVWRKNRIWDNRQRSYHAISRSNIRASVKRLFSQHRHFASHMPYLFGSRFTVTGDRQQGLTKRNE